jgi:hypothetical protein
MVSKPKPKLPVERGKVALIVKCLACRRSLWTGSEAASFAVSKIFAGWRNHLLVCKRIEVMR